MLNNNEDIVDDTYIYTQNQFAKITQSQKKVVRVEEPKIVKINEKFMLQGQLFNELSSRKLTQKEMKDAVTGNMHYRVMNKIGVKKVRTAPAN